MPESPGNIEEIHSSLKASLHRGHKQQNLDQDVVAASKRVLLDKVAFEPASSPYTMQMDQLRAKYIFLNAGATSSSTSNSGREISQHFGSSNGSISSSGGGGGGDSLPQPRVILYPEECVKMEWARPGRIGAGLVNMGNTCFFNSTLQCLTYTAPLVNYCLSSDHKQKCTKNGFCMMCEIQNHIRTSLECGGKSIRPHSILQKLRCIAKHMKWGRQEDAHEFLRFVIDHLQQACLNGHAKLDRFSKETTVVNQIFGGYLQSQVICLRCQAKSNTFDPFMDISLDIKGVNTVDEALAKFVKPETLDHDNAYKCPKCKHKVRAQKRFSIHKAPNVLTLQLNRFDFNRHLSGKIGRFIRYTEKINLRSFMSQKQGEPILYHLYGVLVHSGHSSEHGHYYSYVKAPSKIWYCMNDSIVHQAGHNSVFSADAYVLFYARINRHLATGNRNGATAANSKGLNNTQNKVGFIGPVIPNNIKQSSASVIQPHGTPSSEQGIPVKRQQLTMIPRTLQTSNGPKSGASTKGPDMAASTPQATAASALPGSHNRISFPILSNQQRRQQQQQLHQPQHSQQQVSQTSEDGKHIVLQIKHGNSTTMEKSHGGKSKQVDKDRNGGPTFSNEKAVVHTKPHGLVPYCDDDSDSDTDTQKLPCPASIGDSKSSIKNGELHQQPERNGNPPNLVVNRDKSSSLQSPSKFTGLVSKPGPLVSTASSALSSPPTAFLPSKLSEDRKGLGIYLHTTTSPSNGASVALSTLGKAGNITPLELPGVSSCSPASSSVKTSNGTWHVQPQDTGAPSPRGSCSSANSVNSTTEWTLQSKVKMDKNSHGSSKGESDVNRTTKISENQKTPCKTTKSPVLHIHHEKVESNDDNGGKQSKQADSNSQSLSAQSHKLNGVLPPSGPTLARPKTPVDISDCQRLLSSPHSSQTSDGGGSRKKHKRDKHHHKEERDERKRRSKEVESNGWGEHSRSSSLDSSGKRKKKHKHKKEKRSRRDRSVSDSESEREERRKQSRKHHYSRMDESSDSDTNSSSAGSRRRKQKKHEKDSDAYEWVEVTKESSSNKHKDSNKRASVQMWNHHVKDDLARRKDSESSKIKSTWDGSRHNKVAASLLGSSYSFGSNVMSWDGDKNHVDKELHAERAANKRHWSDDYNQEIDAGKTKKVKKHKYDDFHGSNPFQNYQQYEADKIRGKHREGLSSWSQDHSYHQHHDHHYHKSWHRKSDEGRYKTHSH